ncbi:MAG: GDP-mannose 4,6-dehydratase [Chloroflexi bacterium]|nr:GDP-mannose 4,6-dehydratase [Chloroflexota bacterium]
MKVLITGITGMAGSHLAEYALEHTDAQVFGTYRWRSKMDNLEDLKRAGKLNIIAEGSHMAHNDAMREAIEEQAQPGKANLIEANLTDGACVHRLIRSLRPDRIFHLAAQSYVPTSWSAPVETLTNNTVSEVNLFEAVREADIDPLIHVAGSSEEYGLVLPDEVPIKESNPLRPLSTYAVSKVAQEMLAWQYHRSYGLKTVVTRGFNHTGPRRGHIFVTSDCARQIAQIERCDRPPVIHIGDLDVRRDWTDVRDTVRGYWMALEKGVPGEVYNIGSGRTYTIREMLDLLLRATPAKVEIRQEVGRLRPSDVRILWADVGKFQAQTGWTPEIPFEKTLRDLLDYWRERV